MEKQKKGKVQVVVEGVEPEISCGQFPIKRIVGDKVVVESARGQVTGVAIVTRRLKPLQVDGRVVHQVGLPWHWGYTGLVTGDSANLLTPYIGDANTTMPEYKAFLVNVRRA